MYVSQGVENGSDVDVTLGQTLDEAHSTAIKAVTLAREVLGRRAAVDFVATPKGAAGDLVTDIDYQAEHLMIKVIHDAFPHHRITAEEGGAVDGQTEWTWRARPRSR